MEELTDEVLLQLLQVGNESALGALYDRYGKSAYSLAFRMLGDVHAAEDAVQEAFINIWRRAGSFSTARGTARTWIMAVVHHRSIDIGRKRRGIAPRELPLEFERLPENPSDTWSEVSNTLDGELLKRCLEQIPEDQRIAIELAYFEGYTQREISELKGIPLGTVKGRIRIGMAKLRKILQELGLGGSTDEP
ncbi:MAG: sigma-70 family RNA polymerase sigma factor [Chloroflexi bacterium]|nr:sigma-70 family RNA polymerase sigma factor [Chloroflexota bacterium]MCI0788680.1 sigma-70 family RNA polymerase sigma factor [Chloroflexota bacterium]MCI0802304.1 sigma-70 family RNA polymerase sigma factor [Chloroflexota bacterium]MCI0829569.1 sigma-70 family RNA polymerase sigma factor [Chloroflexota bacterium]MCI0864165.1 sigma-70 family RNA polymerase sigma factor [Chloroflexota bacterium]